MKDEKFDRLKTSMEQGLEIAKTRTIVCISDTHTFHDKLDIPDGDILIHGGDCTFKGNPEESRNFLTWFNAQPHKHKIYIAGNHEVEWENNLETAKLWREMFAPDCIYLEHESVEIDGFKVFGSPYTPWFFNWAWNVDRGEELENLWALIPEETDILITHGPPYGVGDIASRYDGSDPHVGCKDLLARIDVVKPKLHIFGHIHGGWGRFGIDPIYVNASSCDGQYQPVNKPIVVEL
jgi:predicted phosphohydrolase